MTNEMRKEQRITVLAILIVTGYVMTVVASNWAIQRLGMVPVGFGLLAPAGVYFAGLAFTLRDLTHEALGRRVVLFSIIVGAILSWWVSPVFAVASGVAFLASELADFAVYAPLRERHWLKAVALSNTVGLICDSVLFLWLAFGSLEFISGQVVGKAWMTVLAVAILWMVRQHAVSLRFRSRRSSAAGGGDGHADDGQSTPGGSYVGG